MSALIFYRTAVMGYRNLFIYAPDKEQLHHNLYTHIFPYGKLMRYLKENPREHIKVYAPAELEPSNFYLPKHKFKRKVLCNRTAPKDINLKPILKKAEGYDYLCLPEMDTAANNYKDVIREIRDFKEMKLIKVFDFKGNRLSLFAKASANA